MPGYIDKMYYLATLFINRIGRPMAIRVTMGWSANDVTNCSKHTDECTLACPKTAAGKRIKTFWVRWWITMSSYRHTSHRLRSPWRLLSMFSVWCVFASLAVVVVVVVDVDACSDTGDGGERGCVKSIHKSRTVAHFCNNDNEESLWVSYVNDVSV